MKNEKRDIRVLAQGFYGNRTITEISLEHFDAFLLGWLDYKLFDKMNEKVDRTIVHLPNSENAVVIYNKYQEEKCLQENLKWFKETGKESKPLCAISELNIKIYSRCFLCRIDDNGKLQSVEPDDIALVENYFAW